MKLHTKSLLAPKLLLLVAVVYTLFITIGSFINPSALPKVGLSVSDKAVHFIAHFIFLCIWFLSVYFKKDKIKFKSTIFFIACISIIYGIIIEILQENFTSTREGDFLDILANIAGVFTAVIFLIGIRQKLFALKKRN